MELHPYPLTVPSPSEVLMQYIEAGFYCIPMKAAHAKDMTGSFRLKKEHLETFDLKEHPWCFVLLLPYSGRQEEFVRAREVAGDGYGFTEGYGTGADEEGLLPDGLTERRVPSSYVRPKLPNQELPLFGIARGRCYEPLTRPQDSWELYTLWSTTPHDKYRLLGNLSRPGWYAGEAPLASNSASYALFDSGERVCRKCGRTTSPVFCIQHHSVCVCKDCLPAFLSDVQRAMDTFVEMVKEEG